MERFEATIAYSRSARAVPHPLAGRPFSEGELHAINSPLALSNKQRVLERLAEQLEAK
jgi:hypothetical protein